MKKAAVKFLLGAACLILGIGMVAVSHGTAGMADVKDNVQAIADALAKGDTAGAAFFIARMADRTSAARSIRSMMGTVPCAEGSSVFRPGGAVANSRGR